MTTLIVNRPTNFLEQIKWWIDYEKRPYGSHTFSLSKPNGMLHTIRYFIESSIGNHRFRYGDLIFWHVHGINFKNNAVSDFDVEPLERGSFVDPLDRISQDLIDFNDFPNLRFLNLSNNNLTGTIGDKFNELHCLEQLYLHNNGLKGEVNRINLHNCKNLRKLTLGGNKFTDYEYQRRQLKSTIPECDVDFGPRTGREKKLFIHLTWVQVEGKIYNRVFDTIGLALDYDQSQYQHYNGLHTMAILDLKIDQEEILDNENGPTVEIVKWHGYYTDALNNDLKESFITFAEHVRCAFFVHGDFRPFIFVKHIGYGTRSQQIIERYSDLRRAIQRLQNDSDGKSMAVYDARNGLSDIREVEYKGERLVVHSPPVLQWALGLDQFDTYSIEKDFNEWIKKDRLIFSKYFKKAICASPINTNSNLPFVAIEVN